MPTMNYLAIIAAALSSFVVGGLWYSPLLFARPWLAAAGLRADDLARQNKAIVFGGAFCWRFLGRSCSRCSWVRIRHLP